MNVLGKLSLKQLLLNKKRTLVTVIGVILSVAMITAVTTFAASAQDMLVRDIIATTGNWHAQFKNVDAEKIPVFTESADISQTLFARALGYAQLVGSINKVKPYLFILELDEASMVNSGLELLDGRLPENPGEVAVAAHILYNGGVSIEIGETLELPVGQRWAENFTLGQHNPFREESEELQPEFSRSFVVVGLVARPDFEPHTAPGYTVVTRLERAPLQGKVDLKVQFKKLDSSLFTLSQRLAAQAECPDYEEDDQGRIYAVSYNNDLLAFSGVTANKVYSNIFTNFILITVAIIMVGSVSLIYNAFAISVSERSRQLGMLASVGATARQKRNTVLFESLFIGALGIPLGILAGVGGMGVTFYFVSPILSRLLQTSTRLRLVVSPWAVAAAVFFSTVTILISAWIPARRAARITPITAIRQVEDVKLTRRRVRTSRLTKLLFGFEASLALKNLKRNRTRFRATVVSLTVSLVLFLSVSAFASLGALGTNMYIQDINFDLAFAKYNMTAAEKEFLERVAVLDLVEQHTLEQNIHGLVQVPLELAGDYYPQEQGAAEADCEYQVQICSLDEASFVAYARAVGVAPEEFSGEPGAIALNLFRNQKEGVFTEGEVIKAGVGSVLEIKLSVDDVVSTLPLVIRGKTGDIPMGSTVWHDPRSLVLYVPESVFTDILTELPVGKVEYSGTLYMKTAKPDLLEERIRSIQADGRDWHLVNVGRYAQQEKQLKQLLTVFITGFILLITSISIANIVNTITTSIALRRREFAMLKSVGMTPAGFNRLVRYESIFYGIKSLSFGIPIGIAINYLLYLQVSPAIEFKFTLPWGSYLLAVVSVLAVVFITMLYASQRIKKQNIIDSLKTEIM